MKVEIELFKPNSKSRDFLYSLYVNDLFICSVHNFNVLALHLKKHWFRLLELENR